MISPHFCHRAPLAASRWSWLLWFLALSASLMRLGHALEIGERIGPVELATLDGRWLTMTNYAERRGTVVVFLSARGGAAEEEMQALGDLSSRLRLRGILFVGVFPNPKETSGEARRFAQSRGWLFPIYRDPDGRLTKRFGARATPEAFLLDAGAQLVYRGAIGGTNEPALAPALSALLDGQPVEPSRVPARGAPIGQPAPRLRVEDSFGSVALSSELIFEKIADVPAHHCSTIAEAANGDLIVVWYGGSYESADDQALFLSRRRPEGRVWSKPEVLIRDSIQPPGNAVVFRAGDKRLLIVWCRMEASRPLRRGGGWGETRLFYRTSKDHGYSWSKDQPFLGGVREGLRNRPITLKSGELLLPLGRSFAGSTDGGRTWEHLGAVDKGGQPSVIQRSDGSLLTLLRRGPRILQAESSDDGQTWSKARPTALKNPDAGIAMAGLRNGHLILVFNDSATDRTPLSIARSVDEGRTWLPPLALESNPGEYSYPCVMQASDGRIHITYTFRRYTIKHVELDENWLTCLRRPN